MLLWIILFANIFSFCLYAVDKRKAVKDKWRIKEKTLLLSRVPFSSFGALAGMVIFRHKTKKPLFVFVNTGLLILHISRILYIAGNMPGLLGL